MTKEQQKVAREVARCVLGASGAASDFPHVMLKNADGTYTTIGDLCRFVLGRRKTIRTRKS